MAKKRISLATLYGSMHSRADLAMAYAEDGALFSAAKIFRLLADDLEAAQTAKNAAIDRAIKTGKMPLKITFAATR